MTKQPLSLNFVSVTDPPTRAHFFTPGLLKPSSLPCTLVTASLPELFLISSWFVLHTASRMRLFKILGHSDPLLKALPHP